MGSSSGTWSIQPITNDDWAQWKDSAYGPTQKIVFQNWNGGQASGPIEMDANQPGYVVFFWIIYHVEPPTVSASGNVQTKFGH